MDRNLDPFEVGNFTARLIVARWHACNQGFKGNKDLEETLASALRWWLKNLPIAERLKKSRGALKAFYRGVAFFLCVFKIPFSAIVNSLPGLPGEPRFEEVLDASDGGMKTSEIFVDKGVSPPKCYRILNKAGEHLVDPIIKRRHPRY
ncbi:MAG: hypothetical protein ACE5J0_00450 [Candidatus Paceibacterales bacterium]